MRLPAVQPGVASRRTPGKLGSVLVGLPEASVRESIHRIERALVNLGYARHPGRTVINLAPGRILTVRPVIRL